MKHFIDYSQNVSKQTFSAAVIVDSEGKQVGKIIIRFTDSQIGYNHNVGVIFYPAELNFEKTRKGGTYDQPGTLFKVLHDAGIKVYAHNKRVDGYDGHDIANAVRYDSLSTFNDITGLSYNDDEYSILWAM